jgi:hypothetical protein
MLSAFNEHFSTIPDTRQQSKVEHKLHDILLTLVVGVICGADRWEAIEEVDSGHGRIESLQYWISDNLLSINDLTHKWSGLMSVGMAQCERHLAGKMSKEVRYFICSIETDANVFAQAVRKQALEHRKSITLGT